MIATVFSRMGGGKEFAVHITRPATCVEPEILSPDSDVKPVDLSVWTAMQVLKVRPLCIF